MAFRVSRARLGLAAATVTAGLAFAGVAAGQASAASTLRIMYNPNPTNTSIVVAQQQGYFAKNGLDVKLMTSDATAALLPALGKQFDLLTTTPTSVLQGAVAGLKPILIGGETIETPSLQSSYFIAAKGITTVAQLKGKKIGVVSESGALYDAAIIRLNRAGIKLDQVTFVQVPFADMNADMESGAVQAVVTIYPFQGQMLGEGMSNLGNPVEQVVGGVKAMDAGWVAYAPWVATHKKVLQEFEKAQTEALAWMNTNKSGVASILENSFQLPSFVATTYAGVTGSTNYASAFTSYSVTPKYLLPWVGPLYKAGQLKKKLSTKAVDALVY